MTTEKFIDTAAPLSDADLDEVEAHLGFALPKDLRQHYLRFNGGRPVPCLFPKDDEYFPINEFLPIKYGMRGARFEDTYADLVQGNPLFPVNLIPIASDSGGDYFCYSERPGEVGAICLYQSDYYDEPSRAVVYLANSLKNLLKSLVSATGM